MVTEHLLPEGVRIRVQKDGPYWVLRSDVDAPPPGRIKAAREALLAYGALDETGNLTPRGKEMAKLPLDPKWASLIAAAENDGERALVSEIAALASEATEVAVIDRQTFDALVREEPGFCQHIMRLLVARIRQLATS